MSDNIQSNNPEENIEEVTSLDSLMTGGPENVEEDQEEFERFEKSFLDIYTHKLGTIKSSDAPVTAERFRRDITEALEPLAIEMELLIPAKLPGPLFT